MIINTYTLSNEDVEHIIDAFDCLESEYGLDDIDRRLRDDFKKEIKKDN